MALWGQPRASSSLASLPPVPLLSLSLSVALPIFSPAHLPEERRPDRRREQRQGAGLSLCGQKSPQAWREESRTSLAASSWYFSREVVRTHAVWGTGLSEPCGLHGLEQFVHLGADDLWVRMVSGVAICNTVGF